VPCNLARAACELRSLSTAWSHWRDAKGSDSPRGTRWRAAAIVPDIAAAASDASAATRSERGRIGVPNSLRGLRALRLLASSPLRLFASSPLRPLAALAFVSNAGAAGLAECAQRMEAREGRNASRLDAQHDSLIPRSGMRPPKGPHHSPLRAASPSSPTPASRPTADGDDESLATRSRHPQP
jgi:hypothetical protein